MFHNLKTQAYLDLPYLIAARGIRAQFDRARQLLAAHEARLTFPVDHLRWHAARALIAAEENDISVAKVHASRALEAAACDHSGFRFHSSVGLVTEQHGDVVRKLEAYSAV